MLIKEFRIGAVFGESLRALFANFLPFMIIGFLVNLPLLLYSIYYAQSLEGMAPEDVQTSSTRFIIVGLALGLLLSPIETGAITFGVFQHLRGKPASIGQCLSTGFSRLVPVLGVALVTGLAVAGGFVLLIVPGIIVMCMLYVAVPASVVERSGVGASLSRSRTLTSGFRGTIFGVVFLLGIIEKGIDKLLAVALVKEGSLSGITLYMVATVSVAVVLGVWQSSAACISYYHLRSMKESVDVEEVASVFD